jgi:hypothetical protein
MITGGLDERFGVESAGAGPGAAPASAGPGADDRLIEAMTRVLHNRLDDDFLWALGEYVSGHDGDDMQFAAMLFAVRWQQAARVLWTALFAAASLAPLLDFWAALGVTADHRPAAALTPAVADTCARILLIAPAAPPVLVAIAGPTG